MKTFSGEIKHGMYRDTRFIKTGEFRAPKRGEWFLSGAKPAAWVAYSDMTTAYHIMQPEPPHKETLFYISHTRKRVIVQPATQTGVY